MPVGDLALATLDDQNSVQVLQCFLITLFVPLSATTDGCHSFYMGLTLSSVDKLCFIQPIVNVEEKFHVLCTKDSGVLYEDPNIQVCRSH